MYQCANEKKIKKLRNVDSNIKFSNHKLSPETSGL